MIFSIQYPGFDLLRHKKMMSQVWIWIIYLPLEFRKEQNILNIAGGVGLPLQINPLTIILYHGFNARVLVDVDFSRESLERILAKLKDEERNTNFSFLSLFPMKNVLNSLTNVEFWDMQSWIVKQQQIRQANGGVTTLYQDRKRGQQNFHRLHKKVRLLQKNSSNGMNRY